MTFFAVDPNLPRDGSNLNSGMMRDNWNALLSHSRGGTIPEVPAQILGDEYYWPLDLSANYNLKINVNASGAVTVDCRGASPSSTSLTEVVNLINAAMTTAGVTTPVASNYNGFLLLQAQGSPSGSSLEISEPASNDGTEKILGLVSRGVSFPYTVYGQDAPNGTLWNMTTDDLHYFRYKNLDGAKLVGEAEIDPHVDLSGFKYLRLSVDGSAYSNIDCSGSNPATTSLGEIIININAVYTGVASSISDRLMLKSTTTGSGSAISIEYVVDSCAHLILGLARGTDGKISSRFPYNYADLDWSDRFIRGADVGGAIGTWGLPVETYDNLPTTGVLDGEIRVAKDYAIPWLFDDKTSQGWRRAAPGYVRPINYDGDKEAYNLDRTTAGTYAFVADPFETGMRKDDSGEIGNVVTLVNARDSGWDDVTYPDGRSLHRGASAHDKFNRGTTSNLGTGWYQEVTKARCYVDEAVYRTADTVTSPDYCVHKSVHIGGTDYNVAAHIKKDVEAAKLGSAAAAGLIFRCNTNADVDDCYVVKVYDDGTGGFYSRVGGSESLVKAITFDPPLSDDYKVLRIKCVGDVYWIYWDGSINEYDWEQEAPYNGTVDTDQGTGQLYSGLYFEPVQATAKSIYAEDFLAVAVQGTVTGLPQVSGARLRDSVTAIQALGESGVITDCTLVKPLILEGGNNIGLTQNLNARKITINADADLLTKALHRTFKHSDSVKVEVIHVDGDTVPYGGTKIFYATFSNIEFDETNYSYMWLIAPIVTDSEAFNIPTSVNPVTKQLEANFPDQAMGCGYIGPGDVLQNDGFGKAQVKFESTSHLHNKVSTWRVLCIAVRKIDSIP